MSTTQEFFFDVDPLETDEDREKRWDKELTELQATGYTIEGVGPEGDYPIRNDPRQGSTWDEFWKDPRVGFREVYNLVPLPPGKWTLNPELGMFEPKAMSEEAVRG